MSMAAETKIDRIDVLDAIEQYGGGFVRHLAMAWRRADTTNAAKLQSVFYLVGSPSWRTWWCPRCGTTKTERIAVAEGEQSDHEWHIPRWSAERDADHAKIRAEQESAIAEQRATIEELSLRIEELIAPKDAFVSDNRKAGSP
jgi:hypothetical protein